MFSKEVKCPVLFDFHHKLSEDKRFLTLTVSKQLMEEMEIPRLSAEDLLGSNSKESRKGLKKFLPFLNKKIVHNLMNDFYL